MTSRGNVFPRARRAVSAALLIAPQLAAQEAADPPPPPPAGAEQGAAPAPPAEALTTELIQRRSEKVQSRLPCEEQLYLSTEARISYENAIEPNVDNEVWPEAVAFRLQLPNWKVSRENKCRPSRDTQDGLSLGYSVSRFSTTAYLKRKERSRPSFSPPLDRNSLHDLNRPAVSTVDIGWFGRVCFDCGEIWGAGFEGRVGLAFNSGATVRYQVDRAQFDENADPEAFLREPVNDPARPWGVGPAWGFSAWASYKRFSAGVGINGSVASGVIATAWSFSLTYSGVPDGEDVILPYSTPTGCDGKECKGAADTAAATATPRPAKK